MTAPARAVPIYGRAGDAQEHHLGDVEPADGERITPADVAAFYRGVADEIESGQMEAL